MLYLYGHLFAELMSTSNSCLKTWTCKNILTFSIATFVYVTHKYCSLFFKQLYCIKY